MKEFGDCLRQLREQAQMTLRYLAERVNLSYSFIDSLEKGRYKPTSEAVYSLAAELKTDPDELLKLAGYKPNETQDLAFTSLKDRT